MEDNSQAESGSSRKCSGSSLTSTPTVDSSETGEHISYGNPTPPFDPPCVKFNPPLSIQRRVKVHELLKQVSQEYEGSIQSLLEVGCGGNTPLMQTLLSCDDELPLSILSGIDIDEDLFTVGVDTAFTTCEYGDDDRWRDLTVSLLHGTFERIDLLNVGPFDAITSCEVIEHLDPGPLANFAPVLLGRMNPKVLIVTTPNRDFNGLFEMPYESIEDMNINGGKPYIWDPHDDPVVTGRRYYREPHNYAMRHHDHRFEWTRAEFKEWGDDAAERFGYTVDYHGCGALYDGAHIIASRWRVEEALRRQIEGQDITLDPDRPLSPDIFREVFGHCSQVAIFIRNDLQRKSPEKLSSAEERLFTRELIPMEALVQNHARLIQQLPFGLQFVKSHTFKKVTTEQAYPPTLLGLFNSQRLTIKHLLPVEIQRIWQYGGASNNKHDYEVVVIRTDLKTLWDSSYTVRRACRFHLRLFEHLALNYNPKYSLEQERPNCESANPESSEVTESNIKCRILAMDLEPVREYELITASQKYTDSDSENDGVANLIPEPSLRTVSTTPIIKVKIYWQTKNSERASTLEDAYLNSETLRSNPQDKILSLDEPVESIKESKKRLRNNNPPMTASTIAAPSIPIALVFIRPERPNEGLNTNEDFSYEKQNRDISDVIRKGFETSWDPNSGNEDTPNREADGFPTWGEPSNDSSDILAAGWDD
ncbi:hypothetical protein TWF694_006992 [Orbilia ellipsospora]|uniref:Small RNA 2'-O-methyltransferase n=1 Tax=Orbilia ellipsospora TaxID=2528407 RepID=A0AAV9XQ80_9PEZI